ncbi:MAG: hypothetical protein EOP05_01380 [Proteobacteria bacterium]|nr:MAG: hypothetical protein EOP05_01380 [Pseudomonadota bacterium]
MQLIKQNSFVSTDKLLVARLAIFVTAFLISFQSFGAAQSCETLFRESELNGARFLLGRDANLAKSKGVVKSARDRQTQSTDSIQNINSWLERQQALVERSQSEPRLLERLKLSLLRNSVIKEADIPESYFALQVKIARERGHGSIELTSDQKKQIATLVVRDQTKSLESWIDYLFSRDTDMYPMWAKYWSYTGLLKLGRFDVESNSFTSRSRLQVTPFAELNREALGYVMDAIVRKVDGKSLSDIKNPALLRVLDGANFGKLYAAALKQANGGRRDLSVTSGEWLRFPAKSDPSLLSKSLEGMSTGWCTAAEETARQQLQLGDFWVYYSHDAQKKSRVPRIAIRMEGQRIAEVRGVAKNQNLDPIIADTQVLNSKLNTFGSEGAKYQRRESDMRRLSEIETKAKLAALTIEDLRFLYEIDAPISGFGYGKDPRIAELKAVRDPKADYATIFDIKREEITIGNEFRFGEGVKVHIGSLNLRYSDLRYRELPEMVFGDVLISSMVPEALRGGKLPRAIYGDLTMLDVVSMEDLTFPEVVAGTLYVSHTVSMKRVKLPARVGSITLEKLNEAVDVKFPEQSGDVNLVRYEGRPTSFLRLPRKIQGDLRLPSLARLEGITQPEHVDGAVELNALSPAEMTKLQPQLRAQLRLAPGN